MHNLSGCCFFLARVVARWRVSQDGIDRRSSEMRERPSQRVGLSIAKKDFEDVEKSGFVKF